MYKSVRTSLFLLSKPESTGCLGTAPITHMWWRSPVDFVFLCFLESVLYAPVPPMVEVAIFWLPETFECCLLAGLLTTRWLCLLRSY